MSQLLTVQLSEQTFDAIRKEAMTVGKSPEQVIAESLERRYTPRPKRLDTRTEAEKQAARERFERHFGEVSLGYPTGIDNESIDADLAREYADNHEDE